MRFRTFFQVIGIHTILIHEPTFVLVFNFRTLKQADSTKPLNTKIFLSDLSLSRVPHTPQNLEPKPPNHAQQAWKYQNLYIGTIETESLQKPPSPTKTLCLQKQGGIYESTEFGLLDLLILTLHIRATQPNNPLPKSPTPTQIFIIHPFFSSAPRALCLRSERK